MTQGGEEAAEMISTIRTDHVAMKTWFHSSNPVAMELRKKWGDYPGLWKEVLNWKGWKEARKAYLAHQQKAELESGMASRIQGYSQSSETGTVTAPATATTSNNTVVQDQHGENGQGDSSVPRKRKSRWGAVAESDDRPRKSRWEAALPATTGATATATPMIPPSAPFPTTNIGQTYNNTSSITATIASSSNSRQPTLPGLPGMPANLTPQQQQQMAAYQARLREVNEKLQTVEQDAMRVDSLPRGHRERSQSPPPGTLLSKSCATIEGRPVLLSTHISSQAFHPHHSTTYSVWS